MLPVKHSMIGLYLCPSVFNPWLKHEAPFLRTGLSDYEHYQFGYAIWGIPEPGEKPSNLFNAGFLPSSRELDRFYLCRQIRVKLPGFTPSSENRRILRKGEGVNVELVPRAQFDYTAKRREFFKTYADKKFGNDVMSYERLDLLFSTPIISHLLVFTDTKTGAEVGVVTLFVEDTTLAYYYYAFYDLAYFNRNLGMFMMTSAVELLCRARLANISYLGTCYSENALYKTQFCRRGILHRLPAGRTIWTN